MYKKIFLVLLLITLFNNMSANAQLLSAVFEKTGLFYHNKTLALDKGDAFGLGKTYPFTKESSTAFYIPNRFNLKDSTSFSEVAEKSKNRLCVLVDTLSDDIVYGTILSAGIEHLFFFFSKKERMWIVFNALSDEQPTVDQAKNPFHFLVKNIVNVRVFDEEGNYLSQWLLFNYYASVEDIKRDICVPSRIFVGYILKLEQNTIYDFWIVGKNIYKDADMDMDVRELFSIVKPYKKPDMPATDTSGWQKKFELSQLCSSKVAQMFCKWCHQ